VSNFSGRVLVAPSGECFTRLSRCDYQSLCAVCGNNLAELNPSVCCALVPPCVADVDCALCRQSN